MDFISPRRIHARRLVDIVMGSAINGAKTKLQRLALGRSFDINQGQSKFNESIRANTPNIYLVDPDLLAEEINNYFSEYRDRVNVKDLSNLIKLTITQYYPKISFSVIEGYVITIHNTLIKELSKAEEANKSYVTYRRRAAEAGKELRRLLNVHKISILTDADKMISNINNRIPFVSYTFDASKDINKIVESATIGYYRKNLKISIDSIVVGNIVNAGHVGLYSQNRFLGINMPSALISGIVSRKFNDVEEALGNIAHHIDYGIELSPNYTQKSGMFLDLAFNFTVSMPSSLNTKVLNYAEAKAIRDAAGKVVFDHLESGIREQLTKGSILELLPEVASSPNFTEYILMSLAANLTDTKISPVKHKTKTSGSSSLPTSPVTTSTTAFKQKISARNTITSKLVVKKLKPISSTIINLNSLQILLNQTLDEQIRKNMGTGSELRILNYQTGRFASSVKVERMSQSRQGMITAFYTYMKYPYQTFEPGYQQGYPSSRDPKLLISKSIREIATTIVGNRMRAVSV